MSNRRRTQFGSAAFTEAARRQLMQPATCWERVAATPPTAPSSSVKISKWVPTDKTQQFSDDEGDTEDQPLVPLPEEPDGDEEMDQDESQVPDTTENTTPAPAPSQPPPTEAQTPVTQVSSPKPELTMTEEDPIVLDEALVPPMPLPDLTSVVDDLGQGIGIDLDSLAADGDLQHDLSQLQPEHSLLGDHITDNPFSDPNLPVV